MVTMLLEVDSVVKRRLCLHDLLTRVVETFFLVNGWKLKVQHSTLSTLTGG
jgi:hypothetical protein